MNNEHNPIAQLVTQIQNKWNTEIVPHDRIKLVRWLIKPSQIQLYEGFLKLESTPNGSIPDMTVVLLTDFHDKETHSRNLIKDWITQFKKDKEIIEDANFKWDVAFFEEKIDNSNTDELLIEVLSTFQKALPHKKRILTLCLFPTSIDDIAGYSSWLHKIMEIGLVRKTRLMIFDDAQKNFYYTLFQNFKNQAKSLSLPLDLKGAINKIVKAGDSRDPEVQFRRCIINMAEGVEKSDISKVEKWGKRGLDVAQKTGLKSMNAGAYFIYASMLFNFEAFEKIDELLLKGMATAKQGVKAGDDTCKSLLIQAYGFQASSKQLQKEINQAADLYCKQADVAKDFGYGIFSLNAWWMAYSILEKTDRDRYKSIVEKAYIYGKELEKDNLKSSVMSIIAKDYYNIVDNNNDEQGCKKIDEFMISIGGKSWRETVDSQRDIQNKSNVLKWL